MKHIELKQLHIKTSLFYIGQLIEWPTENKLLNFRRKYTFKEAAPLLIFKKGTQAHLLDGFKRVALLKHNNKNIAAIEVFKGPPEEAAILLLSQKESMITDNTIAKANFLRLCIIALGCDRDTTITNILPLLHINPHKENLRAYLTISKLNPTIKNFCQEKRFSLRQISRISHFPAQLTLKFLDLQNKLHLSASLFSELLEHSYDIIRSQELNTTQLFNKIETQNISYQSPQQYTQDLRTFLYEWRHPVLTHVNNEIKALSNTLKLPKHISFSWDPSLENKGCSLHLNISRHTNMAADLKQLDSQPFQTQLGKILQKV